MMRNLYLLIIVALLAVILVRYQKKQVVVVPQSPQQEVQPAPQRRLKPAPHKVQPPQKIEPEWKDYPAVRGVDASLGEVLGDINAHINNNTYWDSDRITAGHEITHGINSDLRQKFGGGFYGNDGKNMWGGSVWKTLEGKPVWSYGNINGFYCLKNRAAIIQEPPVRIRMVASQVPSSLRGDVYNLYLVQQAGSWDNTPLYLLDEASGYRNGSACRKDLHISERAETVQYMLEFNVYAITLAQVVKAQASGYNDKQFKAYLMWSIEESFHIYANEPRATAYWDKFKTNLDAQGLRDFAKGYFGQEWCKRVLGI